ncbi:hypothetical protein GCM10023321_69810 [Pseudonocardia eucalypti]|uniref:FtsX-like permease family protein n=1 Tax=Pseudonocardia eucalypti TaxID=648755 RepID=A0ABP9R4L1_9PSEU
MRRDEASGWTARRSGSPAPEQGSAVSLPAPPRAPEPRPRETHRRLVPEPTSWWFRWSNRPHASRGIRKARFTAAPPPSQPEWLLPPSPAGSVPAPSPAGRRLRRTAEPRESLNPRRTEKIERRLRAAQERRAAAAALSGMPIPAEAVLPGDDANLWRRAVLTIRATRRGEVRSNSGRVAGQMQEALAAACHSLANNRLRSLLTTTGIIVGVAAVIVLVALGDGMKADFDKEFSRLANQITVTAAKGSVPDGRQPRDLTDRDVQALSDPRQAPDIVDISPAVVASVVLAAGQAKSKASLVGASANYLDLVDRHTDAGRWFTPEEIDNGTRAVVLGPEAVNLLWGYDTPHQDVVGKTVRLSTTNFKVHGVLESNGQDDNLAIVPLDAARTSLVGDNGGKLDLIILKSGSVDTVEDAAGQATDILMARHNIDDPASRDFNVKTFTDWIEKSTRSIKFLAMFIVAVAAISLFVGGVGVANIMLVSVTERTREIGIRKAVGAKTTAIMRQFLSEAVVLTGLGGLVGALLGVALTYLAGAVLPDFDEELPAPILSPGPVLVAFAVSLVIGVLAGGYPAHRAARLRPIQALRFE